MIMKNEIHNLNESLPAALLHVSGYSVCDTGSTDGTPQYVKDFFSNHSIDGQVLHHEWQDFSHNRNLCLRESTRTMGRQCTYWLILDADQIMMSEKGKTLLQLPLKKDAYWVQERTHGLIFHNLRLVKSAIRWEYTGVVHETIGPTGVSAIYTDNLPKSIWTKHDTDYGRGFDKDAALLEAALQKDPTSTRNTYYLGNTYSMLDRKADAMRVYQKRIAMKGSDEERYMAALTTAKMMNEWYVGSLPEGALPAMRELGLVKGADLEFEDVTAAFERAAAILPYRKEAWYNLALLHWQQQGDGPTCMGYAVKARDAGPHGFNTLFSDAKIVEWMVYDQMCTCGLPSGQLQDGYTACIKLQDKLLKTQGLEVWQQQMLAATVKQRQRYEEHLKRGG